MKRLVPFLLLLTLTSIFFSLKQSDPWSDPKYKAANTAKDVSYLTQDEKDVFYYVNLARMDPKKFAEVYVKPNLATGTSYDKSLYATLSKMKPVKIWVPDDHMYKIAKC